MAVIVADTSFLFSLFGTDAHTAKAQSWARQAREPIEVSVLNRYEFGNALRFAANRKVISQADALASLVAFEADMKSGYLQPVSYDLNAIVAEAERLSGLYTLSSGHRSFDILHVATARLLKATTFLTFDANQRKLAAAARLVVGP
jgi:predicted nucleic acid-binding protein